MKVKHVLMIAAILLAMLVMPVVATGSETDNSDTSAETKTELSDLILGVPSTYEVTIPKTIDFKAGAIISASNVLIGNDAALVVTVSSGNVWNLTLNDKDRMKYQMFVGDKTTAAQNDDEVLKIAYPANGDAVKLTFKTDEVAKKSGNYMDTLTFTVEEVSGAGSGVNSKILVISDLEDLQNFRDAVNDGNTYKGWTVKLLDNIDLASESNWVPIGSGAYSHSYYDNKNEEVKVYYAFEGTFDGNDYTISNLTSSITSDLPAGLFGRINSPAIIKNVNIMNAEVSGTSLVGALVGNAYSGYIINCHVSGDVQIAGNYKVGGLVGGQYVSITGCSVIGDTDSKVTGTYLASPTNREGDCVGGIIGYKGEGPSNIEYCTVKSLTVTGTRKVGGIVGAAFGNTNVINCKVNTVTVGTNADSGYAENNGKSMGVGGLVGLYNREALGDDKTEYAYVRGELSGEISNIMLTTNDNSVSASLGYVTGGLDGRDIRADSDVPVSPETILSLNLNSVTLKGECTGANVNFCIPSSV